jgi:alginate O-acetyltransferase complex protein AlgI
MELSYIFDVYNHTSQASHNIIEYALYVSLFPKINMGPIVSYHEMQPQLKHRTIERKEVGTGWLLLIKGLFKKKKKPDEAETVPNEGLAMKNVEFTSEIVDTITEDTKKEEEE